MQRVLVLEDDEDLRFILCELLLLAGVEACVATGSVEELQRRQDEALGCELAILDINLGAAVPSGLEAYRWLRGRGFGGRIVFLSGHAHSHPLVCQAHALSDVQVLAKPVDSQTLLALLGSCADGTG
ncbi:MAG TPA: response regulator [Myxococcaceae bacterium]|nr:response regulator [Myxococcaceae bacterium]